MADRVDTIQLEKSLADLIKVADATKLAKGDGVQIANSGTMSDGKPSGGGQGSMSDAGGLDALMIAKMTAAGIDAGTIANFAAFMADDDDEDEDDGDEDDEGKVPQPPFTSKSSAQGDLIKGIASDPTVAEAIDVSPFLDALVARTTDALGSLEKSLGAHRGEQAKVNRAMAAAIYQSGQLLKSQAGVIDELRSRLGIVERAPVAQPKGRTQLSGAKALSKGMPNEAGEAGQLRKSELLSTLSYMNLEKGIRDINGVRTSEIIGRFEAGDVIDDGVIHAARSFLAQNPNEADAARRYA